MSSKHSATSRKVQLVAIAGALAFVATGCTANTSGGGNAGGTTTLTVATASVPQFDDIRGLTNKFEASNPGIKIKYVNLPEDQLRDQLTQGVATGSSPFDVVSIGPYEVPIWAKNGWISQIDSQVKQDPGFDQKDIIPAVLNGLKYKNGLYAVPISGESSMLMYNKDIFAKASVTMPKNPTWDDVRALAAKVQDKSKNVAGICLRGDASWGAAMAALNPIINAYGGVWYDKGWKPQFSSPAVKKALAMYLDLQRNYGIPGASTAGFPECLTAFGQGNAAMWFDATSAGGSVEDPKTSTVAGKVGYVAAPVESWKGNGWLWSWNLAITKTSKHQDAAWKYLAFFGSKDYVQLSGKNLGWTHAPAATRETTYKLKDYLAAAPFAAVSLAAVADADPTSHAEKTPYNGILFLLLPSYQDFGTQVSKHVSAAISGSETADQVSTAADAILAKYADENRSWAAGK